MHKFFITVKEVIIHKLVDGVFFSSLVCERDGVQEVIDARTSDAIAIAVRFEAPIFTYENILEKAGVFLKLEEEFGIEDDEESEEDSLDLDDLITKNESTFSDYSLKELHNQLNDAVANENYFTLSLR